VNHEGPKKEGEREGGITHKTATHTHTHKVWMEHRETETESGACKRQKTCLEKQVSKLVVKMPTTRAPEDIDKKTHTHTKEQKIPYSNSGNHDTWQTHTNKESCLVRTENDNLNFKKSRT